MKNGIILILGIIITIVIAYISSSIGDLIDLKINFIPHSFGVHTLMFSLSIIAIVLLKKYVNFQISIPRLKRIIKPILFGFLASVITNMIMMSIIVSTNGTDNTELQIPTSSMSVLQIFIFVFIYASIAEEMLFRGFLLNFLNPLKNKGIKFFKRKISIPIIISAIMFGLSHLILLDPERNNILVLGIVISASILGIIAGYYQEKYKNNAYAILVHMAGNLMGVIGTIVMNANS